VLSEWRCSPAASRAACTADKSISRVTWLSAARRTDSSMLCAIILRTRLSGVVCLIGILR